MEAVYRQARAVLDKAAAATNKDQKTAQISLLVELCAYRGDSALVAEVVEGVAGYAADRSAKVRKAVVEFVDAVVAILWKVWCRVVRKVWWKVVCCGERRCRIFSWCSACLQLLAVNVSAKPWEKLPASPLASQVSTR